MLIILVGAGMCPAANAQAPQQPNHMRPLLYVSNMGSGSVSVIDAPTNTVIATVMVGGGPGGLVVSPDGTRVYVVNMHSNTVSVIDTSTFMVINTINVGANPRCVAVNSAGTRAYVTEYGNNRVSIIDTNSMAVIGGINVSAGPMGIVLNPSGTRAYVAESQNNSVCVIDTTLNLVMTRVGTGIGGPVIVGTGELAIDPSGSRVYVANSIGNILAIDTLANTIAGSTPVNNGVAFIAIDPAPNRLYITSGVMGSHLSVVDANVYSVLNSYGLQPGVGGMAIAGTTVYIAGVNANNVIVFDTITNTPVFHIPVGVSPRYIAANPAGDFTPPAVASTNPVNGGNNAGISGMISATFSEPVDANTVTNTSFTLTDGNNNPIPGSAGIIGGNAVFTPSAQLSYSTLYTATLTPGIKDLAGNPIKAPYSWSFTTVAAPAASPSPSPAVSPSPSVSPSVVPTQTPAPTVTAAPSPSPSIDATASPAPAQSPSPTPKKTPGFEMAIALGALCLITMLKIRVRD